MDAASQGFYGASCLLLAVVVDHKIKDDESEMDSYFSFYCRRAAQRAGPVQSGWLTWPPSGDRIEMIWLVREECPVPLIYGTLLHRSPAAAWLGLRRRMAAFMWTSARC